VDGVLHSLGRWRTRDEALLARDRAALHFGLDRPLSFPARAKRLGPLSPEGLRQVVREQVRATRASRFAGVYENRKTGGWFASIRVDGKFVGLGSYERDEEEEAARAVDQAARYYGRTPPNFPKRTLAARSPEKILLERRLLRGTSRYFGVTRRPGTDRPWYFQIKLPHGQFAIGGYESDRAAALAHDRAVLHYELELPVNFPARAKKVGGADIETLRREVHARRKRDYTSRYRGVRWYPTRSCWASSIRVNGISHFVGHFDNELEAARAYDAKARRLLGAAAFLRLNFPNGAAAHRK
jgi:hypothetical protein